MADTIIELSILQTWGKSIGEWHPVRIKKNKGRYVYRCQIKLGLTFFRVTEVIYRKKAHGFTFRLYNFCPKDNSFRGVLYGKKPLV